MRLKLFVCVAFENRPSFLVSRESVFYLKLLTDTFLL